MCWYNIVIILQRHNTFKYQAKQKGKTKAQTQDTLFHNIVRVTCVCFVCRVWLREREKERECVKCICGGPSKYMAHFLWRYKQIIRWEIDYSK